MSHRNHSMLSILLPGLSIEKAEETGDNQKRVSESCPTSLSGIAKLTCAEIN